MTHVSELWRYPVKSLAGERLQTQAVEPRGLAHDRRWMLVDAGGRFLTQREIPAMARLRARVIDDALVLDAPDGTTRRVPVAGGKGELCRVQVWQDRCEAERVDARVDAWLAEHLGRPCQLVRLRDDPAQRRPDPHYAAADDQVSFADGFPLLLLSQGSLDGLNARLDAPLTMRRFRPNLVVEGVPAHAEDGWQRIRIGGLGIRIVKPCARCAITTLDPLTGERGAEPLRTLAGYRQVGQQVMFGQNAIPDGPGELAEGMAVEVLEPA